MRTTRNLDRPVAAAIVLIALLALLAPLLASHCEAGMKHHDHGCKERKVMRCAGLWSAACCDFTSPPRPTDAAPGSLSAGSPAETVCIVSPDALLPSVILEPSALDLLLGERAGPPSVRPLTTVLRI